MERQRDASGGDPNVPSPWQATISIWRSSVVLRQLAAVLIIAVAFVWILMIIITAAEGDLDRAAFWSFSRIALIILAVLVGLTILVVALFYRRAEYRFEMDEHGISASTAAGTRKKNAVINTLLVLSGRPSAMGAGMLAASRQDERVRWKDVDSYSVDEKRRQVALRRRRRTVMLVQCTEENLEAVASFVEGRVTRRG
ncbi:MAG: hypothetical protein JW990_19405 [Thermoleophilia bacterium]|nr:hypothetical protein [Thermoleophilia bacterium]